MHEVAVARARGQTIALVRAFHELTKPGITFFVGTTAVAGYLLSARGAVEPGTLALVMLATITMSGGAAALNHVAERLPDAMMRRTAGRPIPAGMISPRTASAFGWSLSLLGALLALITLPPLTLVFLAACHASYVLVYTPLKMKTPLCTLAGAIPGALPVLAGSAAAGGLPNVAALALTGMLFTWQIPHFFAIGWVMREDYARAGFAMLPVRDVTGAITARACLLYAIATHGFAILVTREVDAAPLVMAAVHTAGTVFVLAVLPFLVARTNERAKRLFFISLLVLPVILVSLMLNALFAG